MSRTQMQILDAYAELQHDLPVKIQKLCSDSDDSFQHAIDARDLNRCWEDTTNIVDTALECIRPQLARASTCYNNELLVTALTVKSSHKQRAIDINQYLCQGES